MKRLATLFLFVIGIVLGLGGAQLRASALPVNPPSADAMAKKCGFDSDCPYGKCSGGSCGSCGFDSDCKGWGKCKNNACGACSFDSDCKGFDGCHNGRCGKSPY
jgi:hypothetical protein